VIPRNYSTEAVVLRTRDTNDADKIITLFTRDFGKQVVIAKGVKKLKSRKRGNIEIFNHASMSIVNTKGMGIITEAQLLSPFEKIRGSLPKTSVAYFVVEVINRTTQDNEKNEEIYELLLGYLTKINNSGKLREIRDRFTIDLLTLLGFWPSKRPMLEPDMILEQIIERKPNSLRVGKKLFS
jgi:DNA repair protein RecO (recombination protein O)